MNFKGSYNILFKVLGDSNKNQNMGNFVPGKSVTVNQFAIPESC